MAGGSWTSRIAVKGIAGDRSEWLQLTKALYPFSTDGGLHAGLLLHAGKWLARMNLINFVASDGKCLPGKEDQQFDRRRIVYTYQDELRRLTLPGKDLVVTQQMSVRNAG